MKKTYKINNEIGRRVDSWTKTFATANKTKLLILPRSGTERKPNQTIYSNQQNIAIEGTYREKEREH